MDEKAYIEAAQLVRNSLLSRSESKSHKSIIKEVQKALDTDDNGIIDREEVEGYMLELGVEETQVNQIINAIDIDRSNKISFRELKLFLFPETTEEVDREFGIVLIAAKNAVIRTVGLMIAEGSDNELLKAFGKISHSNILRKGLLDCVNVRKSFLALRDLELEYSRVLPHEADLLVRTLDTNNDGVVSANEFKKWLMVGRKNKLFASPSVSTSTVHRSPFTKKLSKKEPKILERSEMLLNRMVSRHLRKNSSTSNGSRSRYDNTGLSETRSSLNSNNDSHNIDKVLLQSVSTPYVKKSTTTTTTTAHTPTSTSSSTKSMKQQIRQQVYTQVNHQINRLNFNTGKIEADVYSLKSQVSTLLSAHEEFRGKLNEVYSHYLGGNRKIHKTEVLVKRTAGDVKTGISKLTKAQRNAERRIDASLNHLGIQLKKLDHRVSETQRSVIKGGSNSSKKLMKSAVNQKEMVSKSTGNTTNTSASDPTTSRTQIRKRRTLTHIKRVMKKVIKKEPLWKPAGSLKYWQPPAPSITSGTLKKVNVSNNSNAVDLNSSIETNQKSRSLFNERLRQSVESWTSRKAKADQEYRRLRALNRRHELEVEASSNGSKRKGPRWHGPRSLSTRRVNVQNHLHQSHGTSSSSYVNDDKVDGKKKKPMNHYQKRLAKDANAAAQGRKMMEDLKDALASANVYVSDITIQTENQYSSVLNESKDDWWAALMARKEDAEQNAQLLALSTSRSQPKAGTEIGVEEMTESLASVNVEEVPAGE